MITLERVGNESNPDIRIYDETNSFLIARNNLPDLCWYPEINFFKNDSDIVFVITENDKEIYILFVTLYQDIINGNIFPLTEENFRDKSFEKTKQNMKEENAKYEKTAQDTGLVQSERIILHSEDYDEYNFASVLEIRKSDKKIEVIFKKNKIDSTSSYMQIPTYNVRITDSFGRYWPFNVIFSNFRRKLQEITLKPPSSDEIEPQKILNKRAIL